MPRGPSARGSVPDRSATTLGIAAVVGRRLALVACFTPDLAELAAGRGDGSVSD